MKEDLTMIQQQLGEIKESIAIVTTKVDIINNHNKQLLDKLTCTVYGNGKKGLVFKVDILTYAVYLLLGVNLVQIPQVFEAIKAMLKIW